VTAVVAWQAKGVLTKVYVRGLLLKLKLYEFPTLFFTTTILIPVERLEIWEAGAKLPPFKLHVKFPVPREVTLMYPSVLPHLDCVRVADAHP
jgi:hypothetical protein